MGVFRRVGEGFVAHVDCIFAIFRYVCIPGGNRLFASGHSGGLTVCPVFERILGVTEIGQVIYESVKVASHPRLRAGHLFIIWLGEYLPFIVGVIVNNHLVSVYIAFTGKHDVCSGVFKHRH